MDCARARGTMARTNLYRQVYHGTPFAFPSLRAVRQ
jgi:hypothetical protein